VKTKKKEDVRKYITLIGDDIGTDNVGYEFYLIEAEHEAIAWNIAHVYAAQLRRGDVLALDLLEDVIGTKLTEGVMVINGDG
jgi:hypothetical protein